MKRILVVYFSVSGKTEREAVRLAEGLGADIERIKPAVPYTKEDLDWRDKKSRSTLEMTDESSRPKIEMPEKNPQDYDIVIIGYPIWWGVEPRAIDTYLDLTDCRGKTIVPVATSGGSPIGYSVDHLRKTFSGLRFTDGLLLNLGIDFERLNGLIG